MKRMKETKMQWFFKKCAEWVSQLCSQRKYKPTDSSPNPNLPSSASATDTQGSSNALDLARTRIEIEPTAPSPLEQFEILPWKLWSF